MSSKSTKGFGKPVVEDERRFTRSLQLKAEQGFQGYSIATITFYGPDNVLATKVAVGIINKDRQVERMRRWFPDTTDIRCTSSEIEPSHLPKSLPEVLGLHSVLPC